MAKTVESVAESGIDLSYANLSYTNLGYIKIEDVNLSNADLTRADLYGANLNNCNLSDAILTDSILVVTNFSGSDLCVGANLDGARTKGIVLTDVKTEDMKFSNFNTKLVGPNKYEITVESPKIKGVKIVVTCNTKNLEMVDDMLKEMIIKINDKT